MARYRKSDALQNTAASTEEDFARYKMIKHKSEKVTEIYEQNKKIYKSQHFRFAHIEGLNVRDVPKSGGKLLLEPLISPQIKRLIYYYYFRHFATIFSHVKIMDFLQILRLIQIIFDHSSKNATNDE